MLDYFNEIVLRMRKYLFKVKTFSEKEKPSIGTIIKSIDKLD